MNKQETHFTKKENILKLSTPSPFPQENDGVIMINNTTFTTKDINDNSNNLFTL